MLLLNSFSPLLDRCDRAAAFGAGAAAASAPVPRKNLSRSGATFLLYKKNEPTLILGFEFCFDQSSLRAHAPAGGGT